MKCWCGSDSFYLEYRSDYAKCLDCGTFVDVFMPSEDKLQAFYSMQNYWHDVQVNTYNFPAIEQRAVNDFNDRIPVWERVVRDLIASPKSILEIGCAHGGFLARCRTNGFERVVGVEVDPDTCAYAKQKFNLEEVHAGLWPNVPVEGAFDVVCGFDVLEHFADPLQAVKAVLDRLNPGGLCLWQTPCYRDNGNGWGQFKSGEHLHLFTDSSGKRLMTEAGLVNVGTGTSIWTDDMMLWGYKP